MSIEELKKAFAVKSANKDIVYAYGEGILTEEVPERGFLKDSGITTPTITLPCGNKVYGYECWWMPLNEKDKFVNGRTIEIVDAPKGGAE